MFGEYKWLFISLIALAVLAGTNTFSYNKGVEIADAKWTKAQLEAQQQKDIEQDKLRELAYLVTADINKKDQDNHDLRIKLQGKVNNATDGRVCFANIDALRLWNEALLGTPSVPGDTGKPADSSTGAGVTDRDILNNQIENASRWRECRDHLNQVIQWHKIVRGEK